MNEKELQALRQLAEGIDRMFAGVEGLAAKARKATAAYLALFEVQQKHSRKSGAEKK